MKKNQLLASVERYALELDQSQNGLLCFGWLSALMILMLYPMGLTGNEENYFELAYRTISPEKFTQYHAVFDQSNARFATEYLFGSLVYLFGYETGHAIARIGMALFYAASLTYFFRSLRLSLMDALLTVILFDLVGEQLMGGEWLFYGVESKTLAYAFLFFAFGSVNHNRWWAAIIFSAMATYMHFLVGGFWALVIIILHGLSVREMVSPGKALLLFCVLISPLLYIVAKDQLGTHALTFNGLSADKIYAEIRNPHHIAPFAGSSPFWTFWGWIPGLITTACLLVVMSIIASKENNNLIVIAGIVGLAELILAMLISYLDRHTFYVAKLYLFRPSSLTLFFVITVLVGQIKGQLSTDGRKLKALLTCAILVSFCGWHVKNNVDFHRYHIFQEKQSLIAAVETHTQSGDIVLIEPYKEFEQEYLVLNREIARPTLVSWKFVPTNPDDIIRWYSYIQLRKHIFEQGCGQNTEVPIRWLVSFRPESLNKISNCGPVVWQKGNIALVKVKD